MTLGEETRSEVNYRIREARPEDAGAIAEIYNIWIRKGGATMDLEEKPPAAFRDSIENLGPRQAILVLEEDGAIQGWGMIKPYSDRRGYRVSAETAVYLRPGSLGQGQGTAVKRLLIERCKSYGYHHLVAKIGAANQASIEYNKKLGYEVVGIQREIGHCNGEWQDVCIMQLILAEVEPYRPELSYPDGD